MGLFTRYKRVIYAIIIGILLGIPLSFFVGNILWLPLMIGVCFLISLFCQSAPDVSEKDEEKIFNQ